MIEAKDDYVSKAILSDLPEPDPDLWKQLVELAESIETDVSQGTRLGNAFRVHSEKILDFKSRDYPIEVLTVRWIFGHELAAWLFSKVGTGEIPA